MRTLRNAGSAQPDRAEFVQRLRLQVQSRYAGQQVTGDADRFALHLAAPGTDLTLPLAPLYLRITREPERAAALIAEYVRDVEKQITPTVQAGQFSLARALWCVRSRRYIDELSRAADLLSAPVGDDMVAFVAETLPGSIMRGVPREEWQPHTDDEVVRQAATTNTREHFARSLQRLQGGDRVARDGWRITGDQLFQGSIVMLPEFLSTLADRSGGDVLIGIPERNLLLAVPAQADTTERFTKRVTQAYREAMSPNSRDVLITDGTTLHSIEAPRARRGGLFAWLEA